MANCFVLVERFESALSVLLQYSKSTDSNTVHDCCTVSILVFMSVPLALTRGIFVLFPEFCFVLFPLAFAATSLPFYVSIEDD